MKQSTDYSWTQGLCL